MIECVLNKTPIGTECETHDLIFGSGKVCPYSLIKNAYIEGYGDCKLWMDDPLKSWEWSDSKVAQNTGEN